MTQQQFLQVINNHSYQELLSIYNDYKIDNKRDQFYAGDYSDVNCIQYKMLLKDVKAIYGKLERNNLFDTVKTTKQNHIANKPLNVKEIYRPKIDKHPHINYDTLPVDLRILFNENGKLNDEIKSKHALMNALPPSPEFDEKRKEYLTEILAAEDTQCKNWDVIDNWYNKIPAVVADKKTDETDVPSYSNPVECQKYIDRARKYIQRYSKSDKEKQIEKCKKYKLGLKSLGING